MTRGGNALRSQALFALAWFHAVVQERRTFIPQVSRHHLLRVQPLGGRVMLSLFWYKPILVWTTVTVTYVYCTRYVRTKHVEFDLF